eukprot:TRINITY_DN5679_c1_g2_i1.p1 TRINITY_DN5679_c1_g2~~TRINITY_DN5679_c1_g2_i1.p1  ORF type:complete len:660 (+),score=96.19 TRINITY_DN5679_c1_g2_i1:46-2025(+)
MKTRKLLLTTLRGQKRFSVERRGMPSEEDESLGRGLWGDETASDGPPKSSHFGVFKVPEYDYVGNRYTKSTSIGIDLGTTNSCVSYIDPQSGAPLIVPIEGKKTTPTVIGLCNDEKRYFGHQAFEMMKMTADMTMCSGKRLLGKQIYDKNVPLEVYQDSLELYQSDYGIAVRMTKNNGQGGTRIDEYPVVHIIAMFLRYLKTASENALSMNVDSATISVPAHFNAAQRKATEDAAIIAGLDVEEIIDEPSAAALAYSELVGGVNYTESKKKESKIAVFDLGGGTFDLAVLSIDHTTNGSRIIASGGDDQLGGDDFDTYLLDYWKNDLDAHSWDENLTASYEPALKVHALNAKIALDSHEEYTGTVPVYVTPLKLKRIPVEVTRFEYEELISPLLEKIKTCTMQILSEKSVDPSGMTDILLVGEMTRTPAILKLVENIFKRKPLFSEVVTPGTVVSLGAAVRSKQLKAIRSGEDTSEDAFIFDKNSPQYEKSLTGLQLVAHRIKTAWEYRQKYKTEKIHDKQIRLKAEAGLSEDAIQKMTKEVIDMELWMRKQMMVKSVIKEAKDLISDISVWKDPRQGFIDEELDELLEVLKFWLRVSEGAKQGEEQLAQAVWELRFYFEELAGKSPKTAFEELSSDPEMQHIVNPDRGAVPSRTFVKE